MKMFALTIVTRLAYVVGFACVFSLAASMSSGFQVSELNAKVASEREKYEKMVEEIHSSVDQWAETAKELARKSGKLDSIVEIQRQVERFNRFGSIPDPQHAGKNTTLPDTQTLRLQGARLWKNFQVVQKSYAEAIQALTKAQKQAEADALKADYDKFFEKHDPFPNGSVWTGKVTTRTGKSDVKPVEFNATVFVISREKDGFEVRAEHQDQRHWKFTFADGGPQGLKATKLELTKVPIPALSKTMGTREVLGSEVKYNGATLEFSVIRNEKTDRPTLSYVLTRSQ